MAETIAEAMRTIDEIGTEHTEPGLGDGKGAQMSAASLGVDYEELILATAALPLVTGARDAAAEMPNGTAVLPLVDWHGLVSALLEAGFLYGVRWEQNRGD